MKKPLPRFVLLLAAAATLALSLASAYPKTANCPIDGAKAHSTGKTKPTMEPKCLEVEYNHKGTDYTNPRSPQKFNHVFWVTQCSQ
jgi:hypothetical protein